MTYPQSGPGYGQGDAGQQYGQQQYGQQAGYGQQQYGQQYGQQQYGQQAAYGQQQYGYQAPKPPSQGLPANTPTILAAVIGALGVITLFCGFLTAFGTDGTKIETGIPGLDQNIPGVSIKLFATQFATPWALLAVAGLLALGTFLVGIEKSVVSIVSALTVASGLITIFMFATADGTKAGAIILLITSILAAIAGVLWLLIEAGQIKTAPADASASAAATAAPAAGTAASYGYGQQAQQSYPQAGQSYGQPASSGFSQPTSSPSNPAPGAADSGATTVFPNPEADKQ